LIKEAERAWIEKNKEHMSDDTLLRKVFMMYCKRLGLNEDQVIVEVDWDFYSTLKPDLPHHLHAALLLFPHVFWLRIKMPNGRPF
jgi:hypothetical protein